VILLRHVPRPSRAVLLRAAVNPKKARKNGARAEAVAPFQMGAEAPAGELI